MSRGSISPVAMSGAGGVPLRHDAFESHLAGMGEDGRAVALDMLMRSRAARRTDDDIDTSRPL
jgi:hypothetical protein